MSKTPEELAADYVQAWWGSREDNMTLATRQAFIAGYQAAAPQWISVKDRLPEDSSDVLIAWADGVSEGCFCDERWCREGRMLRSVTHWMPLPKPPEE